MKIIKYFFWGSIQFLNHSFLTIWKMKLVILVVIFSLPFLHAWGNPGCTIGLGIQVCSGIFIQPRPCTVEEVHISSAAVKIDLEGCPEGLEIVFHKGCPHQILNSPDDIKVYPESCKNMVSFISFFFKKFNILFN